MVSRHKVCSQSKSRMHRAVITSYLSSSEHQRHHNNSAVEQRARESAINRLTAESTQHELWPSFFQVIFHQKRQQWRPATLWRGWWEYGPYFSLFPSSISWKNLKKANANANAQVKATCRGPRLTLETFPFVPSLVAPAGLHPCALMWRVRYRLGRKSGLGQRLCVWCQTMMSIMTLHFTTSCSQIITFYLPLIHLLCEQSWSIWVNCWSNNWSV